MEEYYGRITAWRDRGTFRGHDLGARAGHLIGTGKACGRRVYMEANDDAHRPETAV